MTQTTPVTPQSDRETSGYSRGEKVFTFILAAILLFSITGIAGSIWDWYASKQVKSSEDAGHIAGASYTSSWGGRTTAIKTEVGTFLVKNTLQAVNGHRVRIETRMNGDRFLCDAETDICKEMIRQ